MKKSILAAALVLAATSALAGSIQVEGGRAYAGTDKNVGRIEYATPTVLGLTGKIAYDRTLNKGARAETASAVAAKDIVKVGDVTVSVLGGAAYARAGNAKGLGLVYGVGASYPLTKSVDLVADVRQFRGQDRIQKLDGNTVAAGVSVKF